VNAIDVRTTLEYLVPGFIALKLFYVVGLRTRRSDLGWTVLSVAAAAALNALVTVAGISDAAWRVIVATVVGVSLALIAGVIWRWLAVRFPDVKASFDRQAWDAVWAQPAWVQVWIRDGPIVLGAATTVSESAETDDQDLYLSGPSWVDRVTGARTPVTNVVGIWVPARNIQLIQVLDPTYRPPAAGGHGE
jgi:hypothetical protein